jgi:hypothetical protein
MKMKFLSTILAICVVFLITEDSVRNVYSTFFAETLNEECENSCCKKSSDESDKQTPEKEDADDCCCNDNCMCLEKGCFCNINYTIPQRPLITLIFDSYKFSVPFADGSLSNFYSEIYHPPNLI